jgi:hypothetical protein
MTLYQELIDVEAAAVSTTLEKQANATCENEATNLSFGQSAGSWVLMLGRLSIPRPRSR